MKYLKLILIFFTILFLNSCGYKKLNLDNLNDFKINKLEINGEKKLAYKLKNNIEIYSSKSSKFIYNIEINLISTKETKIKNAAGKSTRYTAKFRAETSIINTITKNVYSKTFSSAIDYAVGSTHSDTLNNEKKAIENNLNYISNEIIKFLTLLHVQ